MENQLQKLERREHSTTRLPRSAGYCARDERPERSTRAAPGALAHAIVPLHKLSRVASAPDTLPAPRARADLRTT